MSSTEKERAALKSMYKSPRWAERVDAMNDQQVIAVYIRLVNQKAIKEN